jgi:hypothetical protein
LLIATANSAKTAAIGKIKLSLASILKRRNISIANRNAKVNISNGCRFFIIVRHVCVILKANTMLERNVLFF